jgi:hypothetical protein
MPQELVMARRLAKLVQKNRHSASGDLKNAWRLGAHPTTPTKAVLDDAKFTEVETRVIILAVVRKEICQVGDGLLGNVGEVEALQSLDDITRKGWLLGCVGGLSGSWMEGKDARPPRRNEDGIGNCAEDRDGNPWLLCSWFRVVRSIGTSTLIKLA